MNIDITSPWRKTPRGQPAIVAPAVAREALDRYAWPLPTRIAGYLSIVGAIVGTLLVGGATDAGSLSLTLFLGALFLGAFALMCECQVRLHRGKRAALIVTQLVIAIAMQFIIGKYGTDMGPLILLFAVAVELQFLMPFRYAVLGTAVIWLIAIVSVLASETGMWMPPASRFLWSPASILSLAATTLTGFIFVAAFTRSAVIELIQRHQTSILLDELNTAHDQLRQYVNNVEELAVARERNRMAREIHDTLGHYLTVINVQLETVQKIGSRDHARAEAALTTAKQLASECLGEVRRSVAALRPADLDDVAFPAAVGRLVDELRRSSDMTIHVETHGSGELPPQAETTVYRVIQEALTNVRKHAAARNVWLHLEWGDDMLCASIRDDGCGADASVTPTGFGVRGMRERVAAVGGTLDVATAPGQGYLVTVHVPRTESQQAVDSPHA